MPRLSAYLIRTALGYLALGFTLGGLLLANKGIPIGAWVWQLLPAHIEALLVGWTTQLAMGVAFWMLPRFAGGPPRGNEKPVWLAYGLLNLGAGAAILSQSLSWPGGILLAARLCELGAVMTFLWHAWPRVKALGV
jgi:hypothetical protein